MHEDDKRIAAEAAVGEIVDGMRVGIGTGTTVAFAIAAIARRRDEWPNARFFSTSRGTSRAAIAAGIPIGRFADQSALDLAIDGVDEIDPRLRAIKGGGGALLREKIVASAARRMVAIADGSKGVATLGLAPLPIEVLPFARSYVADRVIQLGGEPTLRAGRNRAYRTDQGNLVVDCRFPGIADATALADALQAIPGVLGNGLFLHEIDALYLADRGIVTKSERSIG